jgi:DNA-binding beta-propeller fold protein YncE
MNGLSRLVSLGWFAASFSLSSMVGLGVVTWVWLPNHTERVTGRDLADDPFCTYCHRSVEVPARGDPPESWRYVSPGALEVSPDGKTLYALSVGMDRLLELGLPDGALRREVALPGRPLGLSLSRDGRRLALSIRNRDLVWVLDTETLERVAELPAGSMPLGLALSPEGDRVYVANGFEHNVWLMDVAEAGRSAALLSGREPYAVDLSRDGRMLAVGNRLIQPVGPGVVPWSEVTLIDPLKGRVLDRRVLESAHLTEGVAVSSDGSFALAATSRIRNVIPITQVARGGIMNTALVYVDTAPGGRTVQLPLDEVNRYYADPVGVVITPDDGLAFVAHAGANIVSAVDLVALRSLVSEATEAELRDMPEHLGLFERYVVARIPTSHTPEEMAVSPDGRELYVSERLGDSIAVVDIARLEVVRRIDLNGPQELTAERRGERVFSNASGTFQGQFSCRSCHPDGHTDGVVWDFDIDGMGRNPVVTRSLRGIKDTAPFKWNGKNPSLFVQCGPRFAMVLTRADPFPEDMLSDLVAFIESIPFPTRRIPDNDLEAVARGKEIFDRTETKDGHPIAKKDRCGTCHRPPLFTDRLKADIGSVGPLDTVAAYDTPQLMDVVSHPPFLHDGRAQTLEEIWTVHSPDDTHGITNDLSKVELNDLVSYLRTL